jgi:uncharacterized protein YfaP (DUF2135 family)
MLSLNIQRAFVACAMVLASAALGADAAVAQTPGAPVVTVLPNNVVQISYDAPVAPPVDTLLLVTQNGSSIGPFLIGANTFVSSGTPVAPGDYTVQVFWQTGVVSPVTAFTVAAIKTTIHPVVVTGNTVAVTWDPLPTATGYDLEVFIVDTGQTFNLPVGNQNSLTVPDVPAGSYVVRVRGRNAFGVGPYSDKVLINAGPTIRVRDLEITLTWNTLADIDLHVIEPNGTHVSWERRNGVTAFLDVDNTTGFGPETISVRRGAAVAGIYEVFIVQARGDEPTTSTVAITLNVGTPAAMTALFTRQTSEANLDDEYDVAIVDVKSGTVAETGGTRISNAEFDASKRRVKQP